MSDESITLTRAEAEALPRLDCDRLTVGQLLSMLTPENRFIHASCCLRLGGWDSMMGCRGLGLFGDALVILVGGNGAPLDYYSAVLLNLKYETRWKLLTPKAPYLKVSKEMFEQQPRDNEVFIGIQTGYSLNGPTAIMKVHSVGPELLASMSDDWEEARMDPRVLSVGAEPISWDDLT